MSRVLFIEKYPHLVDRCAEPEKLKTLSHGSGTKLRWKCLDEDHEFLFPVGKFPGIKKCPVCAGKQIVPGFNDLTTTRPDLVEYWSPSNVISIKSVSQSSDKSVIWFCSECDDDYELKVSVQSVRFLRTCKSCSPRLKNYPGKPGVALIGTEFEEQYSSKNEISLANLSCWYTRVIWDCADCGNSYEATPRAKVRVGAKCVYCVGHKVAVGFNDVASVFPELVTQWDEQKNEVSLFEVTVGSKRRMWWKCENGHSWDTYMYARVRDGVISPCPECSMSNTARNGSVGQREIHEFITSYFPDALLNVRKGAVLDNFELDVFIPSKSIAVEFNGVYWHSDKFVETGYHKRKHDACLERGVQLITVWEDDWAVRNPVVRRTLLHKLGVSQEVRLNARALRVGVVENFTARDFYDAHHIQGSGPFGVSYGLFLDSANKDGTEADVDNIGELVACMSFKRRSEGVWELVRYATSSVVRGGFSRLLRAFERAHRPREVVSFADRMISDGGLYESHGFIADGVTKPSYMYVVGHQRVHKFNYRISRFKKDPDLKFKDGLTESELAKLNGIHKVYDAGKVRYVKDYTGGVEHQ